MRFYRVAPKKYAMDLTGEGARLAGGRWNPKDIPVIYTAEHESLAFLEVIPSFGFSVFPIDIQLVTIDLPDATSIISLSDRDLPPDWSALPHKLSTVRIGQKWANEGNSAILKVPSVMPPYGHGWNFILNPLHPELKSGMSASVEDWSVDERIAGLAWNPR